MSELDERLVITESMIINVLVKGESLLVKLASKRFSLLERFKKIRGEITKQKALASSIYSSYSGDIKEENMFYERGSSKRDMLDIIEGIRKESKIEEDNIAREILEIEKYEKAIFRIATCIETLLEDEKDILERLYVKEEKWDVIANELNISKASISKIRKEAFQSIIELYDSTYSEEKIREIGLHRFLFGQVGISKKKYKNKEVEGQLSLF